MSFSWEECCELNTCGGVVKEGLVFYTFRDEMLLREQVRLSPGEVVFVLGPAQKDDIIFKVMTRAGVGFTLYHELKNIVPFGVRIE